MIFQEKTLAQCVTDNYKTSDVFKKYGLDFCCGGGQTLSSACTQKNLDLEKIIKELEIISQTKVVSDENYNSWSVDMVIDHILIEHHSYLKENFQVIEDYLIKLNRVHSERHPELKDILELYSKMRVELEQHLMKEENVLFPYILELHRAKVNGLQKPFAHFGTVGNPINMMRYEHDEAGSDIKELRKISNSFTVPADGCNTYRVGFKKLEEFETDLFKHIHLENNILFPKALELENGF